MLKPSSNPKNTAKGESDFFTVPGSEYFEYMGEMESNDQYALRNTHAIEALQQNAYLCRGEATCRTFSVGKCFKFKKHEDKSRVGKEYVLSSVFCLLLFITRLVKVGPVRKVSKSRLVVLTQRQSCVLQLTTRNLR